jgi:hypothetical protein
MTSTTGLTTRSHEDHVDVSFFALRLGIVYPVFIDKTVYKDFVCRASNSDRDTLVMLNAAVSALDEALQSDEEMELTFPFHYEHKQKGFRSRAERLYIHMLADTESKPWLLISSTRSAQSEPEASVA